MEVVGYRDSDDTIGVRRAIDELRVHSHALFLTLSHRSIGNVEKIAADSKKVGVHALGMDVSGFQGPEEDLMNTMNRVAAAGEQNCIPTYLLGISTISIIAKAIASGISYVSAPALRPPLRAPYQAEKATLADLYVAV